MTTELENDRFATLSTAHLSAETCTFMTEDRERLPFTVWDSEYGWFLRTGGANPVPSLYTVPDDLAACMAYAKEQGFGWLRLDRDASTIAALPVLQDDAD